MPLRSNLPLSVTRAYWAEVRRLLQVRHKLTAAAASRAVRAYEAAISRTGVRDEIYHAPVADTAGGIAEGGYATAETPGPRKTKPKKPTKVLARPRMAGGRLPAPTNG